jgi:hypothetical protein
MAAHDSAGYFPPFCLVGHFATTTIQQHENESKARQWQWQCCHRPSPTSIGDSNLVGYWIE